MYPVCLHHHTLSIRPWSMLPNKTRPFHETAFALLIWLRLHQRADCLNIISLVIECNTEFQRLFSSCSSHRSRSHFPTGAPWWLKDTSRQQNIKGAGMDRPAHSTHFKLLKKTQKPFCEESLWQGLKSELSMWLRQTQWSLVTVVIVTPV